MSATNEGTCKERVKSHYCGRMADIRELWELWRNDPDATDPELGNFNEYGLCWDYVSPGTFNGQRRGYFRWQLSTGGPSDEFRIYVDERLAVCRIEYWFLDWFDGARRVIRRGRDFDVLNKIWDDMRECGMPEEWMKRAEG